MTSQTLHPTATEPSSPRFLPLLVLLFVGSGCAALIYEIVWLQLLQLVIGSTAVSLGVLLGTFMGGMCLGSLVLPRIISRRRHPLRVYAILELLIGIIGVVIVHYMQPLGDKYTEMAAGSGGLMLRAAVAAVCLLPPTILMGATLPAIARWVETTAEGVSWLGFFYGGNIVGAVVGCLAAGFYLLPTFDMPTATYVAAAINGIIAISALALSMATESRPPAMFVNLVPAERAPGAGWVYLTIAISGMTGLGAEVVWTRLLSLLLGATVYTFSIILAVFLLGLGIGSSVGASAARTSKRPRLALGVCQFLLAAGIAWTAWVIAKSLPYWPVNYGLELTDKLESSRPWWAFQLDLMETVFAVLPPAILWGASFPLALAAVASRGRDPGRLVGGVYAANTVGAIVGAVLFSLVVVPMHGTPGAQRILIVLSAISAAMALAPFLFPIPRVSDDAPLDEVPAPMSRGAWIFGGVFSAILISAVGLLAYSVSPAPWVLVAFGRYAPTYLKQADPEMYPKGDFSMDKGFDRYCTYVGEGMNVSVAITKDNAGYQYFHGAGKVQASSNPQDMRLQRMLGHLSVLAHPRPEEVKDVLVVACGAGVTAGSFVPYPNVKNITICDIEPLVPTKVTPQFSSVNYGIVDGIDKQNPKTMPDGKTVHVIYDDGRHFVRTTSEKFDVVTSDPIDPWVKGCAALNTVEYYQMCKAHLKPGGVMSLWIPFYESNLDTAKSVLGTFFKVFPHGILFSNDDRGAGYDAVLFGINDDGPVQVDVDQIEKLLEKPEYAKVKESLQYVGFGSGKLQGALTGEGIAVDLLATYAGQATDLVKWGENAQINEDRNLRLQYLAGKWLNSDKSTAILTDIFRYYRFPTEMFHGSETTVTSMKQVLMENGRREITTIGRAQ